MEESKEAKERKDYYARYTGKPGPLARAGWLSRVLFNWLNPMIEISSKSEFSQDMHYEMRKEDGSAYIGELFEANWRNIYPRSQVSPGTKTPVNGIFRAIWRTFKWDLILGVLGNLVITVVEFLNAYMIFVSIQVMGKIDFLDQSQTFLQRYKGIMYYMCVFISSRILSSILSNFINFRVSLLGMKIKNCLNILIYKKLMKKCLERDGTFDLGEITNLTQVDSMSFQNLASWSGFLIATPFRIVFGVIMLYYLMKFAMLPALGILAISMTVNVYISRYYQTIRKGFLKVSDKRGKLITELFKNIRYIKMSGLETTYLLRIRLMREEEVSWVRKQFMRNMYANINNVVGGDLFLIVLNVFRIVFTGGLRLEEAFVSSIVYGIFNRSLRAFSFIIVALMDLAISGRRICFFLLSEEINPEYITYETKQTGSEGIPELSIEISDGNFYWVNEDTKRWYIEEKDRVTENKDKKLQTKDPLRSVVSERTTQINFGSEDKGNKSLLSESLLEDNSILDDSVQDFNENKKAYKLVLKEISVKIPRGACVGIIGKVGSGKSSLLSSLLGEMYFEEGSKVQIRGSICYVSQNSWITSKSVKENIIFGLECDEQRLADAIKYSAMEADLKTMNNGLDTILGDRGVNLSGGQKTRMAIARAFYSNRDIYLFDDPISALDIHVGKTVMEEGILTYLRGKTRVISTHALSYLPYFDLIFIMDKGRIIERGTYEEIRKSPSFLLIQESLEKEHTNPDETTEEAPMPELDGLGLKKTSSKFSMEDQISRKVSKNSEENEAGGFEEKEEDAPVKVEADKVIEGIIASEDKTKGDVLTVSLVSKYVRFGGGIAQYLSGPAR
jgi:ATP-binding cassette subfamily C (CFTR/MRP) protein 1